MTDCPQINPTGKPFCIFFSHKSDTKIHFSMTIKKNCYPK